MKNKLINTYTRYLKADESDSAMPRQTPNTHFAFIQPKLTALPQLLIQNDELLEELGLEAGDSIEELLTGNAQLPGSQPFAMCYGGHQFGNWAGQLGDGRAINLFETLTRDKSHYHTVQLKGAGPTAYSRRGDGLAVLRSSIREFICSEAMFHLGVPTTRALSLSLTGDQVMRDMFYDGHPEMEHGAICSRVSSSFTRMGHFEIFAARGEKEELRQLANYVILHDYPHILEETPWEVMGTQEPEQLWLESDEEVQDFLKEELPPEIYLEFLTELMQKTARLMVHWMRVGFVHGVMNTDNLSIVGETIDYGPYGWLESYDPNWTPNTTDAEGKRYAFGAQPEIARWNLLQLANALYPLIEEVEPLQEIIQNYSELFNVLWFEMMANKLGLENLDPKADADFVVELLKILTLVETDYILFFRELAKVDMGSIDLQSLDSLNLEFMKSSEMSPLLNAYYQSEELSEPYFEKLHSWLIAYQGHLAGVDNQKRVQLMNQTNPLYVPRNYLAQEVIDSANKGDYQPLHQWYEILKNPYDEREGLEHFAAKRPEWARVKPGCSMLSCSS